MMRSSEGIHITYVNLRICCSSMFPYNFFNHFLRSLIFFWSSFNENISQITIRNFLLCHLNFCSAFHLKLSDCITTLTNNKSDTIIWNWDNVSIGRWWTVRCHHTIIHLGVRHDLVVNLLSNV